MVHKQCAAALILMGKAALRGLVSGGDAEVGSGCEFVAVIYQPARSSRCFIFSYHSSTFGRMRSTLLIASAMK